VARTIDCRGIGGSPSSYHYRPVFAALLRLLLDFMLFFDDFFLKLAISFSIWPRQRLHFERLGWLFVFLSEGVFFSTTTIISDGSSGRRFEDF